MRLPRDISGADLAKSLALYGYSVTRQTGSPVRLTTMGHGEHHVTVPAHAQLKLGTLAGIVGAVAEHFEVDRNEVAERLFRP